MHWLKKKRKLKGKALFVLYSIWGMVTEYVKWWLKEYINKEEEQRSYDTGLRKNRWGQMCQFFSRLWLNKYLCFCFCFVLFNLSDFWQFHSFLNLYQQGRRGWKKRDVVVRYFPLSTHVENIKDDKNKQKKLNTELINTNYILNGDSNSHGAYSLPRHERSKFKRSHLDKI